MSSFPERKNLNLRYVDKTRDYGLQDLGFIKDLFSNLPVNKKRGVNILELGCCMGHCSDFMQSHIEGSTVIAADLIGNVLSRAKENYPRLSFCQLDAEGQMPFKSGTFDMVFNTNLLEHLFDLDNHMREIHRVLKKGGVYLVVTPNKLIDTLYFRVYRRIANYRILHPSVQTSFSISRLFRKYGFMVRFLHTRALSTGEKSKLDEILSHIVPVRFRDTAANSLEKIICNLPLVIKPNLNVAARKL